MNKFTVIIEHFGGVQATASALGIDRQAVYKWKWNNAIPRLRAFEIERLTNGKLKADDLSPVSK